jgi:hypothetical protein
MEERKELLLRCTDGCSIISFDRFEDENEWDETIVTVYRSYSGDTLGRRISKAWAILTGGSHHLGEVFISKKELEKIKEF